MSRSFKPKTQSSLEKPWLDANGHPFPDDELRFVSRFWDAKTWESYLKTLEVGLRELPISACDPADFSKSESPSDAAKSEALFNCDPSEVTQALESLSFKRRQIVYAIYFEGLTQAQTAKHLGITDRWVRKLLPEAIESLRPALAHHFESKKMPAGVPIKTIHSEGNRNPKKPNPIHTMGANSETEEGQKLPLFTIGEGTDGK